MKYITFPVGPMEANTYLVYSESQKQAVVIDAGGDFAAVKARADGLGKEIAAVLLTHGHFDHTLAAGEYRAAGIPVGISAKDEYMLKPHRDNLSRYFGVKWSEIPSDFTFNDGDELSFGSLVFKVISTPGHTSGSCCFLCDNVCFSGDTLFLEGVGRTDFPTGSHAEIVKSITEKLYALKGDTVICPGHNEQTTIDHEKAFNPYTAELK